MEWFNLHGFVFFTGFGFIFGGFFGALLMYEKHRDFKNNVKKNYIYHPHCTSIQGNLYTGRWNCTLCGKDHGSYVWTDVKEEVK